MKKLSIDLENCFGIRKLKTEFDFSKKNVVLIYAPNGSMKTSLANTFQALSDGGSPTDRVHTDRKTRCEIKTDAGALAPENIFVIVPMNEQFRSEKVSRLLVNQTLKAEYESIRKKLDDKTEALISPLKSASGLGKKDVSPEFSLHFANDSKKFFEALERVPPAVMQKKKSGLGEVRYSTIFNGKVLPMLTAADFQSNIADYMSNYNALISKSRYFRKGVFNHDNATIIAKNLRDNGFFEAEHTITMKAKSGSQEISTEKDLVKVIEEEKKAILTDPKLVAAFNAINDKIKKNDEAREFRILLEANPGIIPELSNLPRLKDKLWSDYLIENFEAYNSLLDEYKLGKAKIEDIFRRAREEKTKWLNVIEEFNRRFTVPFTVRIENQEDVIVKSDAPSLKFDHSGKPIEEQALWDILSMGERRALYLLNIIFEIHGRIEAGTETLFVIDDIADSFDYKNKYAIIEYLKDISENGDFYQLIMSHNFDFYRSMSSRLAIPRPQNFHVSKSEAATTLVEEQYQRNPFIHWRKNLDKDEMLIAAIPFIRNLAEYCGDDANYLNLTQLLHIRPKTESITVGDLQKIIQEVLKDQGGLSLKEPKRTIKALIYSIAGKICGERLEVIELEKKIILSIAIRLLAEEFMIKKIDDRDFVEKIGIGQTMILFTKLKKDHSPAAAEVKILEEVLLMTPENIHLNSFMYEPILDMSNEHLKKLFSRVSALK